jgi:uncharacterized protein YndB with AHSA1/START domain
MSDLTALQVERSYRASAQSVFDAWTNPEVMRDRVVHWALSSS